MLTLALVAVVPAGALADPYSLTTTFDNRAEAAAGSSPIDVESGASSVSATSQGGEKSGCGVDYGRTSAAVSGASARVTANDKASVGMTFSASASAQGGHYRTYATCLGDGLGFALSGRDTAARANARSRAVTTIRFSPDAAPTLYFVRVSSASNGGRLEVKLVDAVQKEVALESPSKEPPTIQGGPNAVYYVTASLAAAAQDEGNCCSQQVDASATLSILLEPAPVAFGMANSPLIVGGRETGPNAYPAVGALSLSYPDGVRFHCTGTLLSATTVLTAAHCIQPFEGKIEAGEMLFTTGKFSSAPKEGPIRISGFVYPSGPADQSAGFSYNPKGYEDDIGIVYLESPVKQISKFSKLFSEADQLPRLRDDQASLTLVGFGLMRDPASGALIGAGVKREVTVPIKDYTNRRLVYSYNADMGGACHGDSGGPTYLTQSGTLIAVTSTGTEECAGQGEQTRVDSFKTWLDPKVKP